jgi:hypothetical protein
MFRREHIVIMVSSIRLVLTDKDKKRRKMPRLRWKWQIRDHA